MAVNVDGGRTTETISVSSTTPKPAPAILSPQSMQLMNPLGGEHPISISFCIRNCTVTFLVRPVLMYLSHCSLSAFEGSSLEFVFVLLLLIGEDASMKGNAERGAETDAGVEGGALVIVFILL